MSTIFHGTSLGNGHVTKRGFSTTNLRARLASTEAPAVVSQRAYLRTNMPSVYQDGDFGLRFLESLEMSLDPIVATLDVLSRYFHSTLAPRDVLGLLASWVGLPVDESWPDDRLREALSRESEISRRRGTKAGLLSSGEQTRLSLAKAMLNLPRLLLLDEPTASIDPSNARDIRAGIAKFVDNGLCGVLWTSHNMYEVQAVCDRVLFLSHGRIVLEGDPKTLPTEHGAASLDDLFVDVAHEALHEGSRR